MESERGKRNKKWQKYKNEGEGKKNIYKSKN
jgi:hypothetical protein